MKLDYELVRDQGWGWFVPAKGRYLNDFDLVRAWGGGEPLRVGFSDTGEPVFLVPVVEVEGVRKESVAKKGVVNVVAVCCSADGLRHVWVDLRERLEELVELVGQHRRGYYRGAPEISDKQYDRLLSELRYLETTFDCVLPNSPTIEDYRLDNQPIRLVAS